MCDHERGPIAIYERYQRHISNLPTSDVLDTFSWLVREMQEPVDHSCIARLGEVFRWQVQTHFDHVSQGEPYYMPMLIQEPILGQARIVLDTTFLKPEPEPAFGD